MGGNFKKKILNTINKADKSDSVSKYFDIFIISLIVLNVIAVTVETVESIYISYKIYFEYFEILSVIVFTIEYVLRLWACTVIDKYKHPVLGRIRYVFSSDAIIDLLAIVPFYLPLLITADTRFLRILRLFRLLRIFKLGRYSQAFDSIITVISKKKEELITTLTFLLVILILASSLMFYVEHEAQPEVFTSIPSTMWWGVATLTTVGYGDVTPITPYGKLIGAVIAILGIGIFALPAGIIAAGFESEIGKKREKNEES